MIKLLRNIRKNLLNEGKTTKYFKYAIGEIFLVVIGILIAVGINSQYNASQNEDKVKAILTQVQEDLKTDIIDAKRIFNVYIAKDSIFQKIMNDSITFEMYKKNPYRLPINSNYVSFSNKKGGYNRFIENLENLPEKYRCLIPYLNDIYIEMQNDIDDYNTFIKNTVMVDGREDLKTNPKIADYTPNETMEYYFKDPFLKNKSSQYMNDLSNISIAANQYRIESIVLYKKIDSLLGKTPAVYSEPIAVLPTEEDINSFLGDYTGIGNVLGATGSLIMQNRQLVLKAPETPDTKLYWHEGDYYFIKEDSIIIRIYKNEEDQHIFQFHDGSQSYIYVKTKDLKKGNL
jgi:hypothetical protein